MHLINRWGLLLLPFLTAACGPETNDNDKSDDWLLGVFSNRNVGDSSPGLDGVGRYEFRDDGTLTIGGVSGCEKNIVTVTDEYQWTRKGDDAVVVELPEDSAVEEWRISPGSDCSWVQVEWLQDDEVANTTGWIRGAVCMKELPPCPEGTSCETCETIWCDEPPPPCEGESS